MKAKKKRKLDKKPDLKSLEDNSKSNQLAVSNLEDETISDSEQPEMKKQKKYLPLTEKLEIIDLFENGMKFSQIAKDLGVPESSVRTICNRKEKYKSQESDVMRVRTRTMERME